MKIEKVIFTIDDNPHYKGFWSSISNHFKNRMGMTPVLFIIGDKVDLSTYDSSNGEIVFIKKLHNIPTIIQALIGKFYFTKTEPETTWLIGDLDLYPLQQYHFKDEISEIDDNAYVHLFPYAYGKDWRNKINGLAGYFHVAKGRVFESELNFVGKTFEDVCNEIYKSNKWGIQFNGISSNKANQQASSDFGWFCCEEMYTGNILKDSKILIELQPKDASYPRIDRSNMIYDVKKLESGGYIDFHTPRPYESHSELIESIVSKIPSI
jgi:hypothetical protein